VWRNYAWLFHTFPRGGRKATYLPAADEWGRGLGRGLVALKGEAEAPPEAGFGERSADRGLRGAPAAPEPK